MMSRMKNKEDMSMTNKLNQLCEQFNKNKELIKMLKEENERLEVAILDEMNGSEDVTTDEFHVYVKRSMRTGFSQKMLKELNMNIYNQCLELKPSVAFYVKGVR